jgi:hypothetical protein
MIIFANSVILIISRLQCTLQLHITAIVTIQPLLQSHHSTTAHTQNSNKILKASKHNYNRIILPKFKLNRYAEHKQIQTVLLLHISLLLLFSVNPLTAVPKISLFLGYSSLQI